MRQEFHQAWVASPDRPHRASVASPDRLHRAAGDVEEDAAAAHPDRLAEHVLRDGAEAVGDQLAGTGEEDAAAHLVSGQLGLLW